MGRAASAGATGLWSSVFMLFVFLLCSSFEKIPEQFHYSWTKKNKEIFPMGSLTNIDTLFWGWDDRLRPITRSYASEWTFFFCHTREILPRILFGFFFRANDGQNRTNSVNGSFRVPANFFLIWMIVISLYSNPACKLFHPLPDNTRSYVFAWPLTLSCVFIFLNGPYQRTAKISAPGGHLPRYPTAYCQRQWINEYHSSSSSSLGVHTRSLILSCSWAWNLSRGVFKI